jgi:antibiotic biosynthesis monooxygenase (ABM) superfamily enzyme
METKTKPYEPVHRAIVVKASEVKEDELDALARFVQRSLVDPGPTGVQIFRPTPGSGKREFLLHRSFLSKEHRRRFYESDLFRGYQRETDQQIEGDALFRSLHGFEAFFRGGNNAPPRWKMAILTWVRVFPTAHLWS